MILLSTNLLHLKAFLEGRITLQDIARWESVQNRLLDGYCTAEMLKSIPVIESIDEVSKREYWDLARELRPDFNRDELTRLCKAFYYLSYLANQEG